MQVSVLSIEDEIKIIKMLDKSVIYTFLHARSSSWVWLGRDHRYPNFLLIRMVRNFTLAKGVRIIEVGLYMRKPLSLNYSIIDMTIPGCYDCSPAVDHNRSTHC